MFTGFFGTAYCQCLASIFAILLLSSCGSTGDPDSGTRSASDFEVTAAPEVVYQGRAEPMRIDEAGAVRAADLFLDAVGSAFLLTNFWSELPSDSRLVGEVSMNGDSGGSFRRLGYFNGSDFILEISFHEYRNGGAYLSGRIKQTFYSDATKETTFSLNNFYGKLELDELRIIDEELDTIFDGELKTINDNPKELNIDALLIDMRTNNFSQLENFRVNEIDGGHNFAGIYKDSENGKLAIETEHHFFGFDVLFNENADFDGPREYLREGIAILTGIGRAEFITLHGNAASIIHVDSTSGIKKALKVFWSDLLSTQPIEEKRNINVPAANVSAEVTIEALVSEPTWLSGLHSWDEDFQFLDFTWHLIHAPNGVEIPAEIKEPYFSYSFTTPGDYMFELTVNDGKNISTVMHPLKVNSPSGSSVTKSSIWSNEAALEAKALNEDGTSYVVSGLSTMKFIPESFNWPELTFVDSNFQEATISPTARNFEYEVSAPPGIYELAYDYKNEYISNFLQMTKFRYKSSAVNMSRVVDQITYFPEPATIQVLDINSDRLDDLLFVSSHRNFRSILEVWSKKVGSVGYSPKYKSLPEHTNHAKVADIFGTGITNIITTSYGRKAYIHELLNLNKDPIVLPEYLGKCKYDEFSSVEIYDFDGNGKLDIVALSPCDSTVILWSQTVEGIFNEPIELFSLEGIDAFANGLSDLNNDGRLDLVAKVDSKVQVYFYNGIKFEYQFTLDLPENAYTFHAKVFDINDDGLFDLLHSYGYSDGSLNPMLEVYIQTSDNIFKVEHAMEISDLPGLLDEFFVYSNDLNGDGKREILLTLGGKCRIFDWGERTITNIASKFSCQGPLDILDFNDDGRLDILMSNQALFLGSEDSFF